MWGMAQIWYKYELELSMWTPRCFELIKATFSSLCNKVLIYVPAPPAKSEGDETARLRAPSLEWHEALEAFVGNLVSTCMRHRLASVTELPWIITPLLGMTRGGCGENPDSQCHTQPWNSKAGLYRRELYTCNERVSWRKRIKMILGNMSKPCGWTKQKNQVNSNRERSKIQPSNIEQRKTTNLVYVQLKTKRHGCALWTLWEPCRIVFIFDYHELPTIYSLRQKAK